jgi:hypothetical protein
VPLASHTKRAGARRERADFEHVLFYRTSKGDPARTCRKKWIESWALCPAGAARYPAFCFLG